MTTATIGARYQVVIPRAVRVAAGIRPREKVSVGYRNGEIVIAPVHAAAWRGIGAPLRGREGPADYVAALRREWTGRG